MTTLQEAVQKFIEATKLDQIEHEDWPRDSQTAFESLRTALVQQGEPVAYITDTWQGPMLWTPEMHNEACTYCDDGEFPVPLYTAAHGIREVK